MRSRLVIVSATGLVAALLGIQLMFTGCRDARVPSNELYLAESRNSETVPRYDVFELSFKHNGIYENNFSDVDVRTIFTSPGGLQHRIQGFFYAADLWKVRFRPDEPGSWRYSYTFTGAGGFTGQGNGVFRCLPSDQEGSVRPNPENPFRWIFASGKPFFPVGLEDCVYLRDGRLLGSAIDGEDRNHPGRKIAWGEYFSVYEKAGFNLFRFSQKNCSYSLMDDLDHYRVAESLATDDLLSSARKHGFRVMFGLFGIHGN